MNEKPKRTLVHGIKIRHHGANLSFYNEEKWWINTEGNIGEIDTVCDF